MSIPTFPQYLKTTDPDVIATLERNAAKRAEFVERATAWANERGFPSAVAWRTDSRTTPPNREAVLGLPWQPEGFGEWTKPRDGYSKPKVSNLPEQAAMKALTFTPEPITSLPTIVSTPGAHPQQRVTYYYDPMVFVHDGAGYAGYAAAPEYMDRLPGNEWVEIVGSEFTVARHAAYDMD